MNRPRGLCWTCYYTPGVRGRYTSRSMYARRGVGKISDEPDGEVDIAPTAAEPGTPEKVAVMKRRAAKGLSIFHPGDPRIEHVRRTREGGPVRVAEVDTVGMWPEPNDFEQLNALDVCWTGRI